MTRQAHWMLLTTDRGGMVRVNVHTIDDQSERIVASADIDVPLTDFTAAEQKILLDAFAIVAGHAGAQTLVIQPVPKQEAPAVPPEAVQNAKTTVKRRLR